LREVIQHEMGHVVTVSGVEPPDHWLVEGIAEYIGMQPRSAPETYSRLVLQNMRPPFAMVPKALGAAASDEKAAEFYALSHYAVECMARKYGETAMLAFVRLRLREDQSRDDAARAAFDRPFAAVEKTCSTWIRGQAR
ncbi:MAG: hypothetical protein ABW022_04045, partial [Actinoplanes sp.]